MNNRLLEAQAAGYAWRLANPIQPDDDGWEAYDAGLAWARERGVTGADAGPIADAFTTGAGDAVRIAGQELLPGVDYISTEEAARRKGVARETVNRLLRNPARRAGVFPGAVLLGVGSRGIWHLPAGEVEAWQPRKAGRPRQQD